MMDTEWLGRWEKAMSLSLFMAYKYVMGVCDVHTWSALCFRCKHFCIAQDYGGGQTACPPPRPAILHFKGFC